VTGLRAGGATDVGKVRANNQDQLLVATSLFAVADGMGGHAAGEVASRVATEALKAAFVDPTPDALVDAVERANRAVWDRAQAEPSFRGMGTTLCALALVHKDEDEELAIVNVGDSRVYLLRQGELEQLTTDHTLVQELVDDGQLSEAEADVHPQRHVLTRALGVDADVEVDLVEVVPYKGDRFLLCSDGLPREVSDAQIASSLRRLADPDEAAKELVSEARARGGNDNITVVVVDVVDDDDRAGAASAALANDTGPVIQSQLERAEPDAGEKRPSRRVRAALAKEQTPGPRFFTVRVVLFIALLVVVIGGAFGAIAYYARGSYYVGLQGPQLTIYRGRPGGLLWFKPTVAQRTGVATTDVLASRLDDLKSGKQEASLQDARQYVQNLQAEAAAHGVGPAAATNAAGAAPTTSTIPTTPVVTP
jgi:serine/threonine protein phosphatase PrpC